MGFCELINDLITWYYEKPFLYTLGIVVVGLFTRKFLAWLMEDEYQTENELEDSLVNDMVLPSQCLRWRGKWHSRSLSAIVNPPAFEHWKPLLVFANRKSGSNQGQDIIHQCKKLLHPIQIHDLSSKPPHSTLEICKLLPNTTFRILVCGGDGSVSWVLSAIEEMELETKPLVSVLPLGTGNDLSITLGWGSSFDNDDTVENFLTELRYAETIAVDRWRIKIDLSQSYLSWKKRRKQFSMLNYFSIGCDALIALNFHRQRQKKPSLFTTRSLNRLFYLGYGAIDVLEQHCKDLNKYMTIWIDEERVNLPDLEGVLFLNISSWGGGCKVWDNFSDGDMEFSSASSGDGLFEVIGFTSSFHIAQIQVNLAEPLRLGQARKVRIILTTTVPAQVDGEPWELNPSIIEIEKVDQVKLLRKKEDTLYDSEILQLETN